MVVAPFLVTTLDVDVSGILPMEGILDEESICAH